MKGNITAERRMQALSICSENNISGDIFIKSRKSECVYQRFLAIKLLSEAGFKVIEIAGFLKLDHSSICYLTDGYVLRSNSKSLRRLAQKKTIEIDIRKSKSVILEEQKRISYLRALRIL